MRLPDPPILVITDRRLCLDTLEARAAALFRSGCRWLSVREKDLTAEARLLLLGRLGEIGNDFGAVVGIHDDIQAALDCGAALHLPAGADAAAARLRVGANHLLGQSCHSNMDIVRCGTSVDFVTLSPVFESESKPGYGPAIGAAGLAGPATEHDMPVLALGGITLITLPLLKDIGLKGVAIMGEAMRTPEPEAWFTHILEIWQEISAGPKA